MPFMRATQRVWATDRRGNTLVLALIVALVLAGFALTLMVTSLRYGKERDERKNLNRSFHAAEAGLNDAYAQISSGMLGPDDMPASIGSAAAPVEMGPIAYWVEIEAIALQRYSIRSKGTYGTSEDRLEMVLQRRPTGFFQYGAFGGEGVELGSNAFVDSYDARLGTYASQVQGGNDFAGERGDVGSNYDITLRSNTEVHGNCQPGPGGILNASAPGTYVSGSTDPLLEEFVLPPIDVPVIPSSGAVTATSDLVLGPGEVHLDSLLLDGGATLTIVGPATVVLDDFLMKSGTTLVFDATGGEVDLHGTGNFVLQSNTDMETQSETAVDVTILLSGNNMDAGSTNQIALSSNADFVGAIYAPRISYDLQSNFNVYGSIICGRLGLASNGAIHFDEALLYDDDGSEGIFDVMLWRKLPHE